MDSDRRAQAKANGSRPEQPHSSSGQPRSLAEKKLAEPKGPAKFEQGGFTSRRRKGPKTLFPGASPGNSFGLLQPRKLVAIEYRASRFIAVTAAYHQREFLLARLQKPQCYDNAVKIPRQLAAFSAFS